MRILYTSKVGFDVVLGAVGENDLLIGPVGAVGEEQSLAQQGRAGLLISLPNSTSILPTTILKQSFVDGAQYLLLFLSQGDHTSESKAALGIA